MISLMIWDDPREAPCLTRGTYVRWHKGALLCMIVTFICYKIKGILFERLDMTENRIVKKRSRFVPVVPAQYLPNWLVRLVVPHLYTPRPVRIVNMSIGGAGTRI